MSYQPGGALSDADIEKQYQHADGAIPPLSDADLSSLYTSSGGQPPVKSGSTPTSGGALDGALSFASTLVNPVGAAVSALMPSNKAAPQLPDKTKPESGWLDTLTRVAQNLPADFQSAGGGILQSLGAMPQGEAAAFSTPSGLAFSPDTGMASAVANITGHPEMAPGYTPNPTAPVSPDLAKQGGDWYAAAQRHLKENAPNIDPNSSKQYAYDIANGAAQMAPLMAASVLTKSPAPLLTGIAAQSYGDAYGSARAAGRSDGEAQRDGLFSAAANALPAELPLHVLMKPGQKFLGKVLKTAASAAAQNTITTALQLGYDKGVLNKDMSWGEAAGALAHAGIVGLGLGGLLGAGSHVAERALTPKPTAATAPAKPAAPPPVVPPNKAAAAVPPPSPGLEPVHDPVTWAQTGWLDQKSGKFTPLAGAPAPVRAGTAAPAAPPATVPAGGAPVSRESATTALATNIDPATGLRPKGNAALREFRGRMQAVVDQVPSAPEFDPTPHLPAARAHIADRSKPINNEALATALQIQPDQAARVIGRLASTPDSGLQAGANGQVRRTPISTAPADVATLIAKNGGLANNEGHDLASLQRFIPGGGPLIRPTGMSLDRTGELLWQHGFFGPPDHTPRPDTDQVLEILGRANDGKVHAPEEAARIADDHAGKRAAEDEATARSEIADHAKALNETFTPEETDQVLGLMGEHGYDAENAVAEYVERLAMRHADTLAEETGNARYREETPAQDQPPENGEVARGGLERPGGEPAIAPGRGAGGNVAAQAARPPFSEEAGAEGLPQTVIPGAEASARQAATAREALGRGLKTSAVDQKAAGGMFAPPVEKAPDLFAPAGLKSEAPAETFPAPEKTVAPLDVAKGDEIPTKPETSPPGDTALATRVKDHLDAGGAPLKQQAFMELANEAYGGTAGAGAYDPRRAYDAMETGANLHFGSRPQEYSPRVDADQAKQIVGKLRDVENKLPIQSRRTADTDAFQQFSTPPAYAYAADWAANLKPDDVVLEPSAGNGGMAVFAKNADAHVIANELSPGRRKNLASFGFDRVTGEDAEQIHNTLPDDVKPNVVLMNPPFSAAAARGGVKDGNITGRHIDQALDRLAPGGRLVAITGENFIAGNSRNAPFFKKWKAQHQIRASVRVSGDVFRRYGTTYPTRVIVIDKAAPDGRPTVTGDVASPEELIDRLRTVRDDRPQSAGSIGEGAAGAKSPADQPAGEEVARGYAPAAGPSDAVPPPTRRGRAQRSASTVEAGAAGADDGRAAASPGREPAARDDGIAPAGRNPAPVVRSEGSGTPSREPTRQPDGRGDSGLPAAGAEHDALSYTSKSGQSGQDLGSDGVYQSYRPQRLDIPGARPHPADLVQSAAMGSVQPPAPTYQPKLARKIITEGKLSDAQLESVVYAGQAHDKMLADGETRRGYMVGDGTGVGKGREISGIILDSMNRGRGKHVWISEKWPLLDDAKRDWTGIGGDDGAFINGKKVKAADAITGDRGIYFTTYDTLKGKPKPGTPGLSRVGQLVKWLGKDFDGVVAFDEAHNMANADTRKGGRGSISPSEKALAGVDLQKKLPKARILYVSATGATEVSNLAYADRLALWGPGTAFPTKDGFISQIENGGVAAMELVARDMKQMGSYISRGLSFEGVKYDRLEHKLTDVQRSMYDNLANAWQGVLQNIDKALELTGGNKDGRSKAAAYSAFWGSHQRFFNQVLTSMQMPTVLDRVQQDLDEGGAPVLQLVNTNEAAMERSLANMTEDEGNIEDLDLTPRDQLMQMVQHSFPVAAMEVYRDENGQERARPVVDSQGNVVQDKGALALRDKVLDDLSSIRVPDGPLEYLLNRFGADKVAEVTGRTRRVIERDGKRVIERRPGSANTAEADAFQSGQKGVLVFSQAGGTGRSYHADLTAKNQKPRQHYLLQPGWAAAPAIQGFGRTHRSNQASKPFYRLATTDVVGQKRFISSIARRLDQLGALTKGQRQTGGQGFFTEKDNLESPYATDAVTRLVTAIVRRLPDMEKRGLTPDVLTNQMGLRGLVDERSGGINVAKIPNVPQFLNRLLSLTLDMQDKMFGAFDEMFGDNIDAARAAGTLDTGVEQLRADHINVVHDQVVHTDAESGAQTRYVALETKNRTKPRQWEDVEPGARLGGNGREVSFIAKGENDRAFAFVPTREKTDDRGAIERQYRRIGPLSDTLVPAHVAEGSKYEQIDGDAARQAWEAELARVPEFATKTEHMVTGALLPIWDRLPKGQARVYRAKTDAGDQLLGRVIPVSALRETLKKLGANAQKFDIPPPDLFKRVLEDGDTATLANGWKLSKRTVAGEPRMRLTGPDPYQTRGVLERQGVQFERIGYEGHFFVPNNERGTKFLETQLKQSPIVSMGESDEPSFAMRDEPAPAFYSALTRGVEGLKLDRAPAEQWRGTVKNLPGVKADELAWSGLDDFLSTKTGTVSKADVLAHLHDNEVDVKDHERGRRPMSDEGAREYHDMSADMWDSLKPAERADMQRQAEQAETDQRAPGSAPTKFNQYTLPGGQNYRELLLTLPHREGSGLVIVPAAEVNRWNVYDASNRLVAENVRHSAAQELVRKDGEGPQVFLTKHFDEPNILAHVRFDDRTGPNGEKILHMAEVQSDWHQAGRRKGYEMPDAERVRLAAELETAREHLGHVRDNEIRDATGGRYRSKTDALDAGDKDAFQKISAIEERPAVKEALARMMDLRTKLRDNASAVPNAPFKTSWHELALKRMLRYAAEHGYDKLSWDTGETQADRYDLSKQIDHLNWNQRGDGTFSIATAKNGETQFSGIVDPADLPNNVGKEMADRIIAAVNAGKKSDVYTGLDLKIGGEGQRGFYDKILPAAANKIGKRFGAKVGETTLDTNAARGATYHAEQNPDGGRDFVVLNADGEIESHGFATIDDARAAASDMEGHDVDGRSRVHSIDITPAMRESVMQGQPLFHSRAPKGWDHAENDTPGGMDAKSTINAGTRAEWRFSPEFDAKRAEIEPALRQRLDKLGLKDTALKLPDQIRRVTDGRSSGADGFRTRNLIAIALDASKDYGELVDHEAIHELRGLDLFTPEEWAVLSRKAGSWKEKYHIANRYDGLSPEKQIEEAVAHAFPDWRAGRLGNAGNLVHRIFRKMADFYEAVGNAFRGHGFKSVDSVFRATADGGRRGDRAAEDRAAPPDFARRRKEPDDFEPKPPGVINRILGEKTQDLGARISAAAARIFPDSVKEAADAAQMALTPMAQGSVIARATAKDFANAMRKARVIGGRQIDYLAKTFKPDELRQMWDAADQQSVLMQRGESTAGRGLSTLTPAQRTAVETFQADSNAALKRAQEIGLFKSEGLPSYVPRMVVAIGGDGKYERLGAGEGTAHGLDQIGRNLKTTSPHLKYRKYLTTAETEAAAGHISPDAVVVRDFRTLPLASMRLNEAIAGRELINNIRRIGNDAGELTVSEGADPGDVGGHKWFTIDHPAFKTYRPKFVKNEDTGKTEIMQDQNGNELFERVPLYVRGDFEGPLRAVLSRDASKIYQAAMTIKGKSMSIIMYSPLMHNAVIWGKAFPAAPLKLLKPYYTGADGKLRPGIALYGEGRAAKNDPVTMKEALDNGLDPVGHRYFNQDASAIMEEPSIKPGRSWTAQAIGAIPNLFSKDAGDAVKRAIDRAGDVWHNKLLWDLVGDLQMGLYTHMRDKAIAGGDDAQTASRYAAHFANRYAGALPMENMSKIARQTANMLLFSRSFTLTNLGAFKDVVVGLPKDIQSQILRDKGVEALNRIQGTARRKAIALLAMDIFLSHVGLFMAQYALAWANGEQFAPPSQNEPDKQNRFLMGYQDDGTAIYGRLPTGKVGEELQDWVTEPAAVLTRKLSPFGRLLYGAAANDQGFGQKIYDPYDKTVGGYFKNIGRIATFAAESVAPLSPFNAMADLVRGRGERKTNIEKLLLPMMGVTVSKGAPGGPAVGLMYSSKDQHSFRVQEAMPDIRAKIRDGDIDGATQAMIDLGLPAWRRKFTIMSTQNPRGRLTRTQLREFQEQASPEDQADMQRFLDEEEQRAPDDKHSDVEPRDLGGAIADPAKLRRAADAGMTWSRHDAIEAAEAAGMPATAALLRQAREPFRPELARRLAQAAG